MRESMRRSEDSGRWPVVQSSGFSLPSFWILQQARARTLSARAPDNLLSEAVQYGTAVYPGLRDHRIVSITTWPDHVPHKHDHLHGGQL